MDRSGQSTSNYNWDILRHVLIGTYITDSLPI